MPKSLSDYSLNDFLHLRPVTQGMKTRRYKRMDEAYFKLDAPAQDLSAVRQAIGGRRVIITVAFEDDEALAMQCALMRHYVDFDVHLVLDNSRSQPGTDAIRSTTEAAGALYVKLPANPWTGKNGSRSHGIAMNWGWHHILKPARPRAFGFVDHDLFPIRPVDPFAPLASQRFYGDLRWAGPRWFLWAGYCFFDFEAVCEEPLDFGLDWFVGLDTGGANWEVLYRHTDPAALPPRPIEPIEALPGVPLDDAKFEIRGEWIHEVGWGTRDDYRAPKRKALMTLLESHLPRQPAGQDAQPAASATREQGRDRSR